MEIQHFSQASSLGTTASVNSADLYMVAVANLIPTDEDNSVIYLSQRVSGATLFSSAVQQGGNSQPAKAVSPPFFPYATAGSECALIIDDLSWAHDNLESGWEYVLTGTKNVDLGFFVTGILNSSKTDFNDPFETGSGFNVFKATCWPSKFAPGLNPF